MTGAQGESSLGAAKGTVVIDKPRSAPSETPAGVWTRRAILLAFWAVIVALGLPHWIWTTSIPRASLPLDAMNDWAEGKACQLHYPINIDFESSVLDVGGVSALVTQVESLLNDRSESTLYSFHVNFKVSDGVVPTEADKSALMITFETDHGVDSPQSSLRSWVPVLDIRYNPAQSVDLVSLAPFVVDEIRHIFADEQRALSHSISDSPFANTDRKQLTPGAKADLDARNTRAFKHASAYHLTFSLFTASASPSTWEIDEAIQRYIQPLLSRLSQTSHLTVDTQVQLYASFSPSIAGPVHDPSSGQWKLQDTDLSGFINAAEWPLSPGIGAGPTMNFVLYIPSQDQTPLVLADTGGSSWIIPQWGGVQILNLAKEQRDTLTIEDLRTVMLTFGDQLTSLLGVPPSPPSLSLRISSLTRESTTSLILSASSTLGALARLTLKLTSIAIPDLVARNVNETIYRLDKSCEDLRAGRFQSALENARVAETEAEQAFFEPSMVGQVYFPDEHKVAVYVPLLGPMAVPLVMAALKELRRIREKKAKVA